MTTLNNAPAEKLELTVQDWATGTVEKVRIPVDAELAAAIEAEKSIAWCECAESEDSHFAEDGRCDCGIAKHHYHCRTCLKVSQIG